MQPAGILGFFLAHFLDLAGEVKTLSSKWLSVWGLAWWR